MFNNTIHHYRSTSCGPDAPVHLIGEDSSGRRLFRAVPGYAPANADGEYVFFALAEDAWVELTTPCRVRYTCEGSVRGPCGVYHVSLATAYAHVLADRDDCAAAGWYSDRRVVCHETWGVGAGWQGVGTESLTSELCRDQHATLDYFDSLRESFGRAWLREARRRGW